MIQLTNKYVLHIPECFHDTNGQIVIPKTILDKLYYLLQQANYDFYVTQAGTFYHNRTYPTTLITLYTAEDNLEPITIFKEWFKNNNNELHQESLAYEYNNTLIIDEIK